MNKIACEIDNLEKAFGPNKVLRGIDLKLYSGEITVLMGANGAGKSTLVKILCGVHQPDSGKISLFGSPFTPEKPADAFRTGVVTVHQSINDGVIPDLDVASNLMLDQLNQKDFGFCRMCAMHLTSSSRSSILRTCGGHYRVSLVPSDATFFLFVLLA